MIVIPIDQAIKVAADEFCRKVRDLSGVHVKHFEISRKLDSRANEKPVDDEICITIRYYEK